MNPDENPSGAEFKVLLVEDDQFKQEEVEQLIREERADVHFVVCRSVQQAVQQLRAGSYDLIVLDISLPSHESRLGGAQPISQPNGGVEILLELAYEGRSDRVLILTQYPEIEYNGQLYPLAKFQKVISGSMAVSIAGVLPFKPKDPTWREQLRKVLLCGA